MPKFVATRPHWPSIIRLILRQHSSFRNCQHPTRRVATAPPPLPQQSLKPSPATVIVPRNQAGHNHGHTYTNHRHPSRIAPILDYKLTHLAALKPISIYHRTLYQLGLLPPTSSQPEPANPKIRSPSWSLQLFHLLRTYVQSIRTCLQHHHHHHQPHHPLHKLASDLIDCTKLPSIETSRTIDNLLLSHFIPWAATESRRAPLTTPSNRSPTSSVRYDQELQASFVSISKLIDIRRPEDLYPDARRYKRQIHLHVGPTNSGKTHTALRALHSAHTGIYAGPLRLLAHEVFTRLNNGQIAHDLAPRECNLITGEEHKIVNPSAGLTSCTVEMLSSHQFYDVVVIDEIQMIGDPYRGDAWTQAFLSVQAKEIHLCGEESVIDLIRQLTESCGDRFILHRYQRLTPLKISDSSLAGDLSKVRRGDCLVTFSRNNIYDLKKAIQATTNLRVGMAYGGLPPEVREREAQMFNLGSQIDGEGGYDVLVGSDAIGMGLNLKIKRVIFESLHKFDGKNEVQLSTSQIKQIGGRAGRFGILSSKEKPNESSIDQVDEDDRGAKDSKLAGSEGNMAVGEVLTLNESDMELLRRSMVSKFEPVRKAVLKAPFTTIEGFARRAPNYEAIRYSNLLELRKSLTITRSEYSIGDERNAGLIGDGLESIKSLSLSERDLFTSAPANPRNPMVIKALQKWAQSHGNRSLVDFENWLRFENVNETMESMDSIIRAISDQDQNEHHSTSSDGNNDLQHHSLDSKKKMVVKKELVRLEKRQHELIFRLESIHKCLVLYLWLSYRLPESFINFKECSNLKLRCEVLLSSALSSSISPSIAP